jgi:hypothetical protein
MMSRVGKSDGLSGAWAEATRTVSEGRAEAMVWRALGRASAASAGRQMRSSAERVGAGAGGGGWVVSAMRGLVDIRWESGPEDFRCCSD